MINIETLLETVDCEKGDLELALERLEQKYEPLFYTQTIGRNLPECFEEAVETYNQQLQLAYEFEVCEAYENFLKSLRDIRLSGYNDD